jgi:hypothetical protein
MTKRGYVGLQMLGYDGVEITPKKNGDKIWYDVLPKMYKVSPGEIDRLLSQRLS